MPRSPNGLGQRPGNSEAASEPCPGVPDTAAILAPMPSAGATSKSQAFDHAASEEHLAPVGGQAEETSIVHAEPHLGRMGRLISVQGAISGETVCQIRESQGPMTLSQLREIVARRMGVLAKQVALLHGNESLPCSGQEGGALPEADPFLLQCLTMPSMTTVALCESVTGAFIADLEVHDCNAVTVPEFRALASQALSKLGSPHSQIVCYFKGNEMLDASEDGTPTSMNDVFGDCKNVAVAVGRRLVLGHGQEVHDIGFIISQPLMAEQIPKAQAIVCSDSGTEGDEGVQVVDMTSAQVIELELPRSIHV